MKIWRRSASPTRRSTSSSPIARSTCRRTSARVFAEIFRVLKPGGELYFSDVFADRRPPPDLADDPVLLGECLAGAMYVEDFRRLLRGLGCLDYRVVSRSETVIDNPAIEARVGRSDSSR